MNYKQMTEQIEKHNYINQDEFREIGITKGLRQSNGNGIVIGITNISDAYGKTNGKDCDGKIIYRGIDLEHIVSGISDSRRYGYEETAYLLLAGKQPSKSELEDFITSCFSMCDVKKQAMADIVSRETGNNIMNCLARCILCLYDYDENADDFTLENVTKQIMNCIFAMSILSSNIYKQKVFQEKAKEFLLDTKKSLAENILYIIRNGGSYTSQEAHILDLCMVLHAELGAGNNSAFTTQVITSAASDTYSVISSAICSIKGRRHGGANKKAFEMMKDIKNNIVDVHNEIRIEEYLTKIVNKEVFDGVGLIYGVGHAVFTLSDPRALIFKKLAHELAISKGREDEFYLYEKVERIAPRVIQKKKNTKKAYSINVDFYSGFIYDMLGIQSDFFTPMFVNARIAGWGSHELEEMCNMNRIMHPAFKARGEGHEYIPLEERN